MASPPRAKDAFSGRGLDPGILEGIRSGLPGGPEALRAIEEDLDGLETAVLRIEEGTGRPPAEELRAALDAGSRARFLIWLSGALAGDAAPDPLGFIDEEIGRVERSARGLARSRGDQRETAEALLERAAQVRLAVSLARARRLVSRPPVRADEVPEGAAAAWCDARDAFDVEAQVAGRARAAGRPPPGPEIASLRSRRESALLECGRALGSAAPERAAELIRKYAAELADAASAVLSETAAASPLERLPALRSLEERIGAFLRIARRRGGPLERGVLPDPERRDLEKRLRTLEGARRRAVRAEREASARVRLEGFFGARAVRIFEAFLLAVLAGFLVLIAVEWRLPEDSPWIPAVRALDIAFCAVIQLDFVVRWGFARWSGAWFLRHFFLESLPALPYGFILDHLSRAGSVGKLEGLRAIVLARLLGLRSVLIVLVRAGRILAFFVQGSDRIVERFRPVLDRDVLLFEPLPASEAPEHPVGARLARLESRRERAARAHHDATPPAERLPVLEGHLALLEAEALAYSCAPAALDGRPRAAPGEIHLERLIGRLLSWDAARVTELMGPDGAIRVRRWLRFLDLPLLRHAPIVRRLAPAGRIEDPAEAVAAAGQTVGEMLEGFLGGLRFWGDLSGITTGPQILDRVATAMIAASRTPAFRLILFGGLLLFLEGLVEVLRIGALEEPLHFLRNVVGLPLLVIGTVCLAFFQTGRWLKRIAGEALDVYLRTADAHFYSLLKMWKLERLESDARLIHRSVFRPESILRGVPLLDEEAWVRWLSAFAGGKGSPAVLESPPEDLRRFLDEAEAAALLYRDFLDSPILSRDDDRTSKQILGNLVVQDIRFRTLRMKRREVRKLEKLSLEKDRLFTLGPYFWFRFITESLAIETAKLVMEYKTSCIPREELHVATPRARERFRAFLEARRQAWSPHVERVRARALACIGEPVLTDEFHAFDFLAIRPERDRAIRERFGDDVLEALRRDRRGMVRDIFGTHPYHLLPRERRTVNPYGLYRRYLGGARFLLLPLVLALGLARATLRSLRGAVALVREVLGRGEGDASHPDHEAGYDVAMRKIGRMRKPFFMEALRLRAAVDLQYLGLRLPGCERDGRGPHYLEDLEFIGARGSERRPLEAVRAAAERDLRRFRALAGSRGWLAPGPGGELSELFAKLDPTRRLEERSGEAARAIVTAFITDEDGLRTCLLAPGEARALIDEALEARESIWMRASALPPSLRSSRRRRRALVREYIGACPEYRGLSPAEVRKVKRRLDRFGPGAEAILSAALERLRDPSGEGELAALRKAAWSHVLWTRRILTSRTIQAMTVLDMRSYRDMVRAAGEYGEGPRVPPRAKSHFWA